MSKAGIRGAAAIVGVADDASPTGQLDIGGRQLEAVMIEQALADAGLTIADVDGVCHTGSSVGLAEYLGVHPRFTDSTNTGGSSFEVYVEHAAAAIAAGIADVIVSVYASTPRGDRARGGGMGGPGRRPPPFGGGPNPQAEWEIPSGIRMPMGAYALAATRHMALYGTTPEQLAQIAVSTREWASMNPKARYQDPLTIEIGRASCRERV